MDIIKDYKDLIQPIFKDKLESYLESLKSKRFSILIVNLKKISSKDFLSKFPYNLKQVEWLENGFYFDDPSVSKHPYYHAGLYYIQEASASIVGASLDTFDNQIILDACAAPGGKSFLISSKLKNNSCLVSNDISSSRLIPLVNSQDKAGFLNNIVTAFDLLKLDKNYNETFDAIVLDVPCSGESMFRKDLKYQNDWISKNHTYYKPIQIELLKKGLDLLKPGGQLIYSTCTFNIHENEEVIKEVLDLRNDFKTVNIKYHYLFEKSLIEEIYASRLYPFNINGDGHFICKIIKNGTLVQSRIKNKSLIDIKDAKNFISNLDVTNNHFKIIDDRLYLCSNLISFDTYRNLRSGKLLGTYIKDKFIPSTSLSRCLNISNLPTINFDVNDINVIKYLKGETLNYENKYNGYVLICVDNFPLGYAISNGITLKNKYEKGWCIQ